jgi:hypothetical protein
MQITLDIPQAMEVRLREVAPNLDHKPREALGLQLFREEKITHYELGQLLGLDRFETDAFHIDNKQFAQSPTLEDLESDC